MFKPLSRSLSEEQFNSGGTDIKNVCSYRCQNICCIDFVIIMISVTKKLTLSKYYGSLFQNK